MVEYMCLAIQAGERFFQLLVRVTYPFSQGKTEHILVLNLSMSSNFNYSFQLPQLQIQSFISHLKKPRKILKVYFSSF
ncbi:hypothetical protein QQP08_018285 [Theobroma cacao]|nr:hypothetical protein QQP08_018285 [Theobroma cacao]